MAEKHDKELHIGEIIRDELVRQGRKMPWFAEQLNTDVSNAYKILKRNNIDLFLLIRISKVLRHDFLQEVSQHIRKNN